MTESWTKKQIRRQYTEEKVTSLKNNINLHQFRKELDNLSDDTYDIIHNLVKNATIKDIKDLYNSKKLTCENLVVYYLKRIEKYDVNKLNSILELNPDAIEIARKLDSKMDVAEGKLYGIPVILKDNIATGDKMHNTAGAYALKDSYSLEDSFVAMRLRSEGAIILAKSNMSEWACFMSSDPCNGYSALGGQTHNPYGHFDVGGSSSGSAVAVAANFATVALGTETCGSVLCPSNQNSVVGIKPSLGLVSRSKVIPITCAQDTIGVFGKSIEDTALVLDVISAYDENDPITIACHSHKENYNDCAKETSLKGTKIAVIDSSLRNDEEKKLLGIAIKYLCSLGAEIIDVTWDYSKLDNLDMGPVFRFGFRKELEKYLESVVSNNIHTLQDIVNFNNEDIDNRAPFGQDTLERSANDTEVTDIPWNNLVKNNYDLCSSTIDSILKDSDVILTLANEWSMVYAPAGYPAINIPAGYMCTGEPLGITFVGSKFDDGKLLRFASAYEKLSTHRRNPNLK